MANTNISLVGLDFESIKSNLKQYLRGKPAFQDYDFEGSNITVLLDILAYNTYMNSFYLNMVASEMFMDSAVLRDSIVSHAKELNYLPRSFKSSYATVQVSVVSDQIAVVIPKYTTFTSKVGSNSYTFSTKESVVINEPINGTTFSANVEIYEGTIVVDSFVKSSNAEQRFVLSNPTVDTNSVEVTVVEDNGQNVFEYTYAESIYNITSISQVFYLQAAENQQYELIFGNGFLGRSPKDGSSIVVTYRSCSGELPNGASAFTCDVSLGGNPTVDVLTVIPATGGSVAETAESIRLNAPRTFTTQQRAVTSGDYETLLRANFSEIVNIAAYGGEEIDPPEFGKVFLTIDINNADGVPENRKRAYKDFISNKSPLAIEVVIVDPEFTFYQLTSTVSYNAGLTRKPSSEIRSLVLGAIESFNVQNLNGFNKTLRYSKLLRAIDEADVSILGNVTEIKMVKRTFPIAGSSFSTVLNFNQALETEAKRSLASIDAQSSNLIDNTYGHAVRSTPFIFDARQSVLVDDGKGALYVAEYITTDGQAILSAPIISAKQVIGSVDYSTGKVIIDNLIVEEVSGSSMKIIATPLDKNVSARKNDLLNIDLDQTIINVVPVTV